MPYFLDHIWLIPLFPLAGAALMLFFGRRLSNSAVSGICVGSVGVSFIYALGAFFQLLALPVGTSALLRKDSLRLGSRGACITTSTACSAISSRDWGFLLDPLSGVMILVVTGVGLLIHIYSTGYMAHEGGYYRFFGYLNLFMFSMLMLVLANNLLLLFVGWEGVGTVQLPADRILLSARSRRRTRGRKPSSSIAMGDAGFLLGIFLTSALLGTIRFHGNSDRRWRLGTFCRSALRVITAIALLLFVGATGKSAQIPLYVWLPDAMEGPTPVSALIHAATMVTAGVYMVTRTNAIFQLAPLAMEVVAVIGAVDGDFCRVHRRGAERHQESSRVFDDLAARLHVSGVRRGRIHGRNFPPDDARVLQRPCSSSRRAA